MTTNTKLPEKTYQGAGCSIGFASKRFNIPYAKVVELVDDGTFPTFVRNGKTLIATYALHHYIQGRSIPPFRFTEDAGEEDYVKKEHCPYNTHKGLVPQDAEPTISDATMYDMKHGYNMEDNEHEEVEKAEEKPEVAMNETVVTPPTYGPLNRSWFSKDIKTLTGYTDQELATRIKMGEIVPYGKNANRNGGYFFTEEEMVKAVEGFLVPVKIAIDVCGLDEKTITKYLRKGLVNGEKDGLHWLVKAEDIVSVFTYIKPRKHTLRGPQTVRKPDGDTVVAKPKAETKPKAEDVEVKETSKVVVNTEAISASAKAINSAYTIGYTDGMRMMAVVAGLSDDLYTPPHREWATNAEHAAYIKGYVAGTESQS